MEADLAGGHLVSVWRGDDLSKFRAYCNPGGADFCWVGPDRDTTEEATEDGRTHHPGHEPTVSDAL